MRGWWATLQAREQRPLTLGMLAIILTFGYLFLFEPLSLAREQVGNRVQSQRALFVHLQQVAQEAAMLQGQGGAMVQPNKGKRSVLAAVDQSSRSAGIKSSIKRLTPEGNDRVRLWLEKASFDHLMGWLIGMNQSDGLVIDNINITPEDETGLVRVNLTLVQP